MDIKKIALVEWASIDGNHRIPYIKTLVNSSENDFIVILPQKSKEIGGNQVICKYKRGFLQYVKWLLMIKREASKLDVDIVHFVDGDNFYRYFGFGLGLFKKHKVLVTFHHMRDGILRRISYKIIFRKINKGIIHTSSMFEYLNNIGIVNVEHIEYPKFRICNNKYTRNSACHCLGLDARKKIILALGGTRLDKGLDDLLEALNHINNDFLLLVAGKAIDFDEKYIENHSTNYSSNVKVIMRILSDEEIDIVTEAADIIALPYKKEFDGASGPLVEGVWRHKLIIGPSHGSLKAIIEKNHLGYVFESGDVLSLAAIINKALLVEWKTDKEYEEYRNMIDEEEFKKRYNNLYKKWMELI